MLDDLRSMWQYATTEPQARLLLIIWLVGVVTGIWAIGIRFLIYPLAGALFGYLLAKIIK